MYTYPHIAALLLYPRLQEHGHAELIEGIDNLRDKSFSESLPGGPSVSNPEGQLLHQR